jgi:hypothetical protein
VFRFNRLKFSQAPTPSSPGVVAIKAGWLAEAAEQRRLVGGDGLEPPTSCV